MKTDIVRVFAPARLHLGFLDLNGNLGRMFGGIGLGLAEPATRLTLRRSQTGRTQVSGPEAERARRYLDQITLALDLPGTYRLDIDEAIPSHAGLGSGTQLALSVAAALRHLHHLPLDPDGDAARLGRGLRSGLGAGLFRRGGLLVDGGKGLTDTPPPIVAALPFPPEWRIILVLDPTTRGVHGDAEIAAFRNLPPFPAPEAATICRLTLMQLLPALAERDIGSFGQAIHAIQRLVGAHFAPAQGGIFASRRVSDAMQRLDRLGAYGSGQSSWGPTGFAFAPDEASALAFRAALLGDALANGLDIRVASGRSGGAIVETLPQLADA